MKDSNRPPLLILGAPPRGGNHLLRGLLDGHPELLLPPDEDYAIRHLARSAPLRWLGALTSPAGAPAFYRRLQKGGHLERVNSDLAAESFGTAGSLDLECYYDYIRSHHRRGIGADELVRNHVEGMSRALGFDGSDARMRVYFCALQPSNRDLIRVGRLLARSYSVRGVFVVRDPRAHLSSKLVRNPGLALGRYCRRQNRYVEEIDAFRRECGPAVSVRFEELVLDTEAAIRRVCEVAGIAFSEDLLDYTQGGKPSRSNSSFAARDGIDSAAVTRYREMLPAEISDYVERHCRVELLWRGSLENASG
ncbi:sulfotransferase [Mangrovimicrobium sediminis]|uniref:sulfotransferase n=1 Tax=Mangrovimicrobium sediminis TaxID=2562682 RepID=UPI00143671ED|nr:sulfotransferase [Haliea sp. SAOS-164]